MGNTEQFYLHTAYQLLSKDFKSRFKIEKKTKENYWFIFKGTFLLVYMKNSEEVIIPYGICPVDNMDIKIRPLFIGEYKGKNCFAVLCANTVTIDAGKFIELRPLFQKIAPPYFALAGLAHQLLHWAQTNQYCGVCGSKTHDVQTERAKQCLVCNELFFPRVTPAVIVAITKGKSLLLARSLQWTKPLYSVIAGFVEPGETLVQAVHREVKEETNIDIKNVRYFGSQPWPFPTQLMVAYTAEWQRGKIKIDTKELCEARWVAPAEFKYLSIPSKISIARELIDWFLASAT